MENPFKKLDQPPHEVPSELKKKVMDDIASFQFFADVANLFSSNYGQVAESFFKKRKTDKNKNK